VSDCITYILYFLYYFLADIQHSRDVSLKKSRAIPVRPLFALMADYRVNILCFIVFILILALTMWYFCRVRSQSHVGGRKLLCHM